MKKFFMTAFAVLLLVTITGLSQAAQKAITQYSNTAAGISYLGPISPLDPTGDTGGMGDPIVTDTGAVVSTPTTINLGGSIYDAAGAIWYQGDSDLAYCISGVCNFGQGLRAFFNFQFTTLDSTNDSTNSADGFVFAILNASLNTLNGIPNRSGGAPPQTSMGELMGYAGPDDMADTLGLRPPKMGIEFDTYPNGPDTDLCHSGSRNDTPLGNSFRNHIALMFWGDALTGLNCTYGRTNYSRSSFDDNRHGSGLNSSNPGTADPLSGYYQGPAKKPGGTYNWMENGVPHTFRIEIDRLTNADGTGSYTTRAWVDFDGTSCSTDQATHFQDVVNAFTDIPPQINRTVTLSAADHLLMDRILFGFTEATGGATQIATITNFLIYFPKTPPAPPCYYSLSSSDNQTTPLEAGSGSSGTINVTAGTGCSWTALESVSWLNSLSPSSGTGNGTVTFTASSANTTGSTRSANITVAGQTFTVYQAPCTYSISPPTNTLNRSAYDNQSFSVTTNAGCTWTTTDDAFWISGVTGSGSGSGTVSYDVSRNYSGSQRTGHIYINGTAATHTVIQNP